MSSAKRQPKKYFDVLTYTGTGAEQKLGGLKFSPDLVWVKSRTSGSTWHYLMDSVRGPSKEIYSNTTNAEATDVTNGLQSFDSNGFTLGTEAGRNAYGGEFVAGCWNGGDGEAVVNNDGNVECLVKASPESGFSVVTSTVPSGYEMKYYGHGLNSAPALVMNKRLDGAGPISAFTTLTGGTQIFNMATASAAGSTDVAYEVNDTTIGIENGTYTDIGMKMDK